MKVGVVGCGNIGSALCQAVSRCDMPASIAALTDIDIKRAEAIREMCCPHARVCNLEQNAEVVDLLVECACAAVVPDVVEMAISKKRQCLIMSVGGLLACPELVDKARDAGYPVRVPSGALCGLDGVRCAREAGLEHVVLTTTKPPQGLEGAPYIVENGISLVDLTEPYIVFDGTAREACKAFPSNVNVAAALSLAGIGPDRTRVRVVADPNAKSNRHEVFAEGAFGSLRAVTDNLPSPRNPKSSYLASLSAIAELRTAAESFLGR